MLAADDQALPETKFAHAGEVSIAYQVVGDGPIDLIIVPGIVSHVEFAHELPGYTSLIRRLTSYARVVTFDKRGQGLSDRVPGVPTLDERMDDLQAVMKAVGISRAGLLGMSEGAAMCALFAATWPEQVSHLVLFGGTARFANCDDYKLIYDAELIERSIPYWGKGLSIKTIAPSFEENPETLRLWARFERLCLSPGSYKAMLQANMLIDVRAILPQIRVPTLVAHRTGDRAIPVANGRYLAQHIPGARYIEYPVGDHAIIAAPDLEPLSGDIEEFLTGHREQRPDDVERVLATILFTDIVDSTRRLAELGDAAWRRLLAEHDAAARRLVEQHRGRLVKSTGDGVLATFDGPARAIRCAQALVTAARPLGVPIRSGLHTGEIELLNHDIGGLAVHVAARIVAAASPGEVWVSRVVTDLVAGSGLSFANRGAQALKGLDGTWELFAVSGS
jgi:class 3 adenylate cyclase